MGKFFLAAAEFSKSTGLLERAWINELHGGKTAPPTRSHVSMDLDRGQLIKLLDTRNKAYAWRRHNLGEHTLVDIGMPVATIADTIIPTLEGPKRWRDLDLPGQLQPAPLRSLVSG